METIKNNAQQSILNSVDYQLLHNDPPETKATYDRLISQGYDDKDARQLLSAAISAEVFMILKHKEPFDRARFVSTLRDLPRLHAIVQ